MEKSSVTILLLFLSVFLSNLAIQPPFSLIFGVELNYLGRESRTVGLNIFTTTYLFRCLLTMFELVLIGHFMEKYKLSFLWILFINAIVIAAVDVIRNIFFDRKDIYVHEPEEIEEDSDSSDVCASN